MKQITALNNLEEGQYANVVSLSSCGTIRRRLQDLGLIVGTRVECVQRSPLGDPTAYRIRGAVIALRCEDASKVFVEI